MAIKNGKTRVLMGNTNKDVIGVMIGRLGCLALIIAIVALIISLL